MTALIAGPQGHNVWSTMPGWGIVADLTPPELVESRRLATLRKLIITGLAAVLVLCAVGYVFAYSKHSSAQDSVDSAKSRTTALTAEQSKYQQVTRMRKTTLDIDTQVASLMNTDVDVAKLVDKIRVALPSTMSIVSSNVTLSSPSGAATGSASPVDTSGRPQIGTVTLTGSAQHFDDVATYATALGKIAGVSNVVPASNAASSASVSATHWTITFQLNDRLYSHHYDVSTASGGN